MHPLARSAAYGAVAPRDRRRAHGALAAAYVKRGEVERYAWHLGHSVIGPDAEAADALERAAAAAAGAVVRGLPRPPSAVRRS